MCIISATSYSGASVPRFLCQVSTLPRFFKAYFLSDLLPKPAYSFLYNALQSMYMIEIHAYCHYT